MSDRRRGPEGRHVVIEICRSQLHLAVTAPEAGGDDLLLCRSLAWRVEAASLLDPQGAEELRIAIKQLVVEERLAGVAATVLLNGDLCVSRVVIGPSSRVDSEISELTERSQLYLALGSGEKAAAAARTPLDARHEHAVLSVTNRRTVEAVVQAAEGAGLELRAVEASTVSLGRAHGEFYGGDDPAVLVQLDENSIDIVLTHGGRLLLEHRVGGRVAPDQFAQVLTQHHERLTRYCRRQRIGGELSRVLLAGDSELIEAAQRSAAQAAIPVEPFDATRAGSRWTLREATPEPRHAAVLGGALATLDGATQTAGPNLLERWIAESRKHIRPMLLRSAAPIAATLLVAAGLALANYDMGRKNATLEQEVAILASTRTRATTLRLKLLGAKAKIDELRKLEAGAPATPLAGFLERVAGCLPNDVWLDQLQLSDGKDVTVRGASYTESGAYDFVGHLNQAPGLSRVALQETSAGSSPEGPTTAFQVKAGYALDSLDPEATQPNTTASVPRPAKPAPRINPEPRTASRG